MPAVFSMCSKSNSSSRDLCLFKSSSAYFGIFSLCGFSRNPTLLFLKKLDIILFFLLLKDAADKT